MCPPVMMAVSMAMAVAGAAASMAGVAQQQANAQANAQAANRALIFNYGASVRHDRQETEAAIAEKKRLQIAGLEAKATAETASGAAGVGGISVDSLMQEYISIEGRNVAAIDRNLHWAREASYSERQAGQIETTNRIERMYRDLPNPTMAFIGALARVGGDAASSYSRFTTKVDGGPLPGGRAWG